MFVVLWLKKNTTNDFFPIKGSTHLISCSLCVSLLGEGRGKTLFFLFRPIILLEHVKYLILQIKGYSPAVFFYAHYIKNNQKRL